MPNPMILIIQIRDRGCTDIIFVLYKIIVEIIVFALTRSLTWQSHLYFLLPSFAMQILEDNKNEEFLRKVVKSLVSAQPIVKSF